MAAAFVPFRVSIRTPPAVWPVLVSLLVGACAGGAGVAASAPQVGPTHAGSAPPSSNRELTARDFAGLDPTQSLYDAIAGLRPHFLTFRGSPTRVLVDGVLVGSPTALRDLPLTWVARVRLADPDAAPRPSGPAVGTLEVTTRRR
jgi:hypothetical protein